MYVSPWVFIARYVNWKIHLYKTKSKYHIIQNADTARTNPKGFYGPGPTSLNALFAKNPRQRGFFILSIALFIQQRINLLLQRTHRIRHMLNKWRTTVKFLNFLFIAVIFPLNISDTGNSVKSLEYTFVLIHNLENRLLFRGIICLVNIILIYRTQTVRFFFVIHNPRIFRVPRQRIRHQRISNII